MTARLPTMEEVQQAVAGLLDQVRLLNAKVDQHQPQVDGYAQMRAILTDLELKVSNFRNIDSRENSTVALIYPKDLSVKCFDGAEKDFRNFIDDSKA